MSNIFNTLLAKLDEHRTDPSSAQIVREIHDLAAEALPHIEQVLDQVVPFRHPFVKGSGEAETTAPAASPPVAESAPPALPPPLRPPATNWGTNERLDGAEEVRKP